MEHNNSPNCLHEEQIQHHSLQIQELSTRSEYKEERLDKLEKKMDDMDKKLDNINNTLNEIKMQSTKDDTQLELRLTAIETQTDIIQQLSKTAKKDSERITSLETTVRVLKWGISILLAVIPILIALNIIK